VNSSERAEQQLPQAQPPSKKADVEWRLKQIVADLFGDEPDAICDQTRFVEDIGADSLDQVMLISECEAEFDIAIDDEDADKIATFGAAVEYLAGRLEAAA
jgi:acyl carrier protein